MSSKSLKTNFIQVRIHVYFDKQLFFLHTIVGQLVRFCLRNSVLVKVSIFAYCKNDFHVLNRFIQRQ